MGTKSTVTIRRRRRQVARTTVERRRAVDRRLRRPAGPRLPARTIRGVHKTVALQARMVRQPLYAVEPKDVERAIRWLDKHRGGAVFLPDELRDAAAVA